MWNALCKECEVPDDMDTQVQALLDAIHQHHICRLGPADYVQVQQLLVVRPDFNRAELRVALASLLATNQEQWQQIARLFEQHYPEAVTLEPPRGHAAQPNSGSDAPVHQPPVPDRPRGSAAERRPPDPTERNHTPVARTNQVEQPARPRGSAAERRPPEPTEHYHAPVALTDQTERLARQRRSLLERRRLAEQTERNHTPVALTYQVERHAPLDAQAIDDAASLLGRLWHAAGSDDLDVPATIRTSINEGGWLIPIYGDRPVARALTVLVDVERGDHPWLSSITWVLDRWHALGVRYTRFDFRFEPLFVTVHTTGQAIALSHLARHTDGGPLVMISRTLSTRGYRTDAGWLKETAAWPVKAWLDSDPRPLRERHRERQDIRRLEQQYGLQRFPFSAAGLLALARLI